MSANPRRLRKLPTDVYQLHGPQGCLYVGASANAYARIKQHRQSWWFDHAQTVVIDRYPTWRIARNVEGHLIRTLSPLGNLQTEDVAADLYLAGVAQGFTPKPIESDTWAMWELLAHV